MTKLEWPKKAEKSGKWVLMPLPLQYLPCLRLCGGVVFLLHSDGPGFHSIPESAALGVPVPQLLSFARECNIAIDRSRKEFFERHNVLIRDLIEGKLENRNRFRELLLGVKSVGKTQLFKTLKQYMVCISYDACDCSILQILVSEIVAKYGAQHQSELSAILLVVDSCSRVDNLEIFLKKNSIRLLLLIDEFHFTYLKPITIGETIISELSCILGTTGGHVHCIVTGSSSSLRSLVFVKLKVAEERKYPSYSKKIDLNSTKLQPKWIFPMNEPSDFRSLLTLHFIDHCDIVERYIYSGGRPGLALESCNLDDIPYSLTAKYLLHDSSNQSIFLQCLVECMHSYNINSRFRTEIEDVNLPSIDILHNDLVGVPESVLFDCIIEKLPLFSRYEFLEMTFDLADEGQIVFEHKGHIKYISLSSYCIYLQWSPCKSTLTLKKGRCMWIMKYLN